MRNQLNMSGFMRSCGHWQRLFFLAIGFIWDAWHPGWLVYLAAAVVTVAYTTWKSSKE